MRAGILVTGGSGFVGRSLCQALLSRGAMVSSLSRATVLPNPQSVTTLLAPKFPDLPVDVISRLRDIDVVVHCAGRAHVMNETSSDPLASFRQVNTKGTLVLASEAAAAGVKRFIFVSTIGVNGSSSAAGVFRAHDVPRPDTPYAQSKWEAEQGLMELSSRVSMKIFVVRPPMIYGSGAPGNFALLTRLVRTGLPLPFGALNAPRNFVALENIVDLLVNLTYLPDAPPGTYLVSDLETVSTTVFIRTIAETLGLNPWLIPVPLALLRGLARAIGRGEQLDKMAVPLAVDFSSTRDRLGWVPPFCMAVAMRRALSSTSDKHLLEG